MKQIGKKGAKDKKELAAITPALKDQSKGKCMKCGKLPDGRGLQKHHLEHKSQGGNNAIENVQLWCAPCHFGPDGHKTEGMPKAGPRNRLHDWEKQGMRPV